MLTASKVFTIISIVQSLILIPATFVEMAEYGAIGFGFAAIAAVLYIIGIIIACRNVSVMDSYERRVSVIVTSFIFVNVFAGIFYSCWYAQECNAEEAKAIYSPSNIADDAASLDWVCSCCGKEVKYVTHCACGHDYNAVVDKKYKKPAFVEVSSDPAAKKECPFCGAIVRGGDSVCFNCNALLKTNADGLAR